MGEENCDLKGLNRRRVFRIYDEANLFYHKINTDQFAGRAIDFDDLIYQSIQTQAAIDTNVDALPVSSIQEHDTLNVNISSSGIAFTCQEILIPGDILILRVLLLSNMTVITTCCKVVFCRPSNPFERNRLPFKVGTEFIKLKTADKDLLDKHIKKNRAHKLLANGLLAALLIFILALPDMLFDFILGLLSFLTDNLIEALHLLMEIIEVNLDLAVEHIFHTADQQTQVIVFYIQLFLVMAIAYPVMKLLLRATKNSYLTIQGYFFRKKSSFCYFWGEQSLLYKTATISLFISVVGCYILFFI